MATSRSARMARCSHTKRSGRDRFGAHLGQQRLVLRVAAFGLREDQAPATPSAGTLSIGGLLTHAAATEQDWADTVEGRRVERDDQAGFTLGPDDTLARALDVYTRATARTDDLVAGTEDVGRPVPVPQGVS